MTAKVKHPDKMSDEEFLKHMNARHKGAAGIQHFGKSNVPDDEAEGLLRAMHRVLHGDSSSRWVPDNHTHGKADE